MAWKDLNERLIKLENTRPSLARHLFEIWFDYGGEYMKALRFKGDGEAEIQRMREDLKPEEVEFVLSYTHKLIEEHWTKWKTFKEKRCEAKVNLISQIIQLKALISSERFDIGIYFVFVRKLR